MFDVNNKQYILSLSTGRKAYFYYSQGSGILMRWMSEDGKWQEPVPAAKNGLEGFSACLDKDNDIHLLYQDYGGNIIYMIYSEGAWNRKPVLRSKNQDTVDKQLHIACCENGVYAFYIIDYNGKKYLVLQDLKDSDSPVTPKTVDQMCSIPSYRVLFDNNRSMSIFYRALKDGKKISGFKTFETGSLKWSNFQPFPSPYSDLTPICAAGLSGAVHLCLQRNEGEKYCLVHCKVIPGANNWEGITIAESDETFRNTEIYAEDNCIRIFWTNKAGISCRTSQDGGNSWDIEQKLEGFDEKLISCFSYIHNPGGKAHEVRSSVIPGSFKDTLKLAYLNIPSNNADVADISEAESLRKTIADTLKLLSGNINGLHNSIRELYKMYHSLDAAQQQLELDISKYGIKDKFIENDLAKIRSDLKVLKNRMDEYDAAKVKIDVTPGISNNSGEISGIYPENIPLMPGTGFNNVTAGFLKGLKK